VDAVVTLVVSLEVPRLVFKLATPYKWHFSLLFSLYPFTAFWLFIFQLKRQWRYQDAHALLLCGVPPHMSSYSSQSFDLFLDLLGYFVVAVLFVCFFWFMCLFHRFDILLSFCFLLSCLCLSCLSSLYVNFQFDYILFSWLRIQMWWFWLSDV